MLVAAHKRCGAARERTCRQRARLPRRTRETGIMARRRTAGFTLTELPAVVAHLANTATIPYPVCPQARARARQAMCLSNMRQLGSAVQMYLQDYDETFPPSQYDQDDIPGIGNPIGLAWGERLYIFARLAPYVKNDGVFLCPN